MIKAGRTLWQRITSPITAARVLWGVPFSVLSGDIFDKGPTIGELNEHARIMSVNGIWNRERRANIIGNDTAVGFGLDRNEVNRVLNEPHFGLGNKKIGDIFQILGDSFGAITTAALNAADVLTAMGENNPTGFLDVIAHSQGTSVFDNSMALVDNDILGRTNYQGYGGQVFIPNNNRLNDARNVYHPDDGVATWLRRMAPEHILKGVFMGGYDSEALGRMHYPNYHGSHFVPSFDAHSWEIYKNNINTDAQTETYNY